MIKNNKIKYKDIMSLGFKEDFYNDDVYFQEFGFKYALITKKLSDTIYLEWHKETQICEMIRIDNPEQMNIQAKMPIQDLEQLKQIINFFTDEKV